VLAIDRAAEIIKGYKVDTDTYIEVSKEELLKALQVKRRCSCRSRGKKARG
jgi:hypothetical protein